MTDMITGEGKQLLILLHGRGASAQNIYPLAEELGWTQRIIALEAPMRTWYPRPFMSAQQDNEPMLSQALKRIEEAIGDTPTENVVLAGFSQGACLSTQYLATHPGQYKAILAFSGGLIGQDDELQVAGDLEGTPVFLGCAQQDPFIPQERVEKTSSLLKQSGATVTMELFDDSMHTIRQKELEMARRILHE